MKLKLIRENFTKKSSIGRLYANGIFLCYTLEDVDRGLTNNMTLDEIKQIKVSKQTAIPYGEYGISLYNSPHFKREIPLLHNVKGFEFVEIHYGNTDLDSDGCILLGETRSVDFIGNSRKAFDKVLPIIKEALQTGLVTIEITK